MEYKYKELYTTSNSVDKQLRIVTDDGYVIDNETLNSEDFTLTESLCSNNELLFGICEAAQIKFRVSEIAEPLKGKWLTVSEVLDGHTDEPFVFGRYKVESDVPTADRSWRDVTAYDAMYDIINADVSGWYNSLNFPMTLKAFRSSFIGNFGLQEVSAELVNDNMIVAKGLFVKETTETTMGEILSGKDVIYCICEANGVFGHINRNGHFEYKSLDNNSAGEDISELYLNGSVKYEDYTTSQITKLQIRTGENDIGVIVGTDGNEYIIQGNFLFYGKEIDELQSIANTLLGKIRYVSYIPFSNEAQGNPCIEVGDKVVFDTARKRITSFVLNRTIKGIQSLKDKYEAKGSEKYSEKVNGSHQSILELKGRYNTLERNIEGTASRVGVIEQDYTKHTEFEQTVNGFNARVESIESEIDGSINVYNTQEEPTLLNYPAMDFTFSIPVDGTVVLGDGVPFEYKPEWYRKFMRSVVYDEINSQTYRFAYDKDTDAFYWQPASDTEFGVAMEKIAKLEIETDKVQTEVLETKTTVTAQGIQIEKNKSAIVSTARSLDFYVEDNKGKAGISISITDPETGKPSKKQIELNADVLNLNASDVINILSGNELNFTAKNISIKSTNFSVTSNGKMTSTSGLIGAWNIGNDNLRAGASDSDYIMLDAGNKSVVSVNGSNKAVLTSGYLSFYKDNIKLATYRAGTWKETNDYGVVIRSEANSKFVSFGNFNDESELYAKTKLLINYGISGMDESVRINGDTLIDGSVKIGDIEDASSGHIRWRHIFAKTGSNDYVGIRFENTGNNKGALALCTGDDATEPIKVQQYSGNPFVSGSSVVRTAYLLDENGNTTFPGFVNHMKFIRTVYLEKPNPDDGNTNTYINLEGNRYYVCFCYKFTVGVSFGMFAFMTTHGNVVSKIYDPGFVSVELEGATTLYLYNYDTGCPVRFIIYEFNM